MSQKTKNELTEETKDVRRNNAAKARQTKKEKADALKEVKDKPISVEDVLRFDEDFLPKSPVLQKSKKKHQKKYVTSSSSEQSESDTSDHSESETDFESESPKKKKKAVKKKDKKSPKAKKLPKAKFNSQSAYEEINTKLNALVQVYLDKNSQKEDKVEDKKEEKKEEKNKPQTVNEAIENPKSIPKAVSKNPVPSGEEDYFKKMMTAYGSQFKKA